MSESKYVPTERRPIAARELRASQAAARWLARRGVSANAISIAGMLCGILAGLSFAATALTESFLQRLAWVLAAVLIQLRLAANMLDGIVAVERGQASRVGELYNEAPDRVSDSATLIGAGYAAGSLTVLGYVAACAALFTAYVRALGKAAGARQEFCGPMAKQQRMFTLTLIALYCGLTPQHWQPAWGESPSWGIMTVGLALILAGSVVTALRRLRRIAANLRSHAP